MRKEVSSRQRRVPFDALTTTQLIVVQGNGQGDQLLLSWSDAIVNSLVDLAGIFATDASGTDDAAAVLGINDNTVVLGFDRDLNIPTQLTCPLDAFSFGEGLTMIPPTTVSVFGTQLEFVNRDDSHEIEVLFSTAVNDDALDIAKWSCTDDGIDVPVTSIVRNSPEIILIRFTGSIGGAVQLLTCNSPATVTSDTGYCLLPPFTVAVSHD